MREQQTDAMAESSLHKVSVPDRRNEETSFALDQGPSLHLDNRALSGSSARVHASALNRATASQPSRAGTSVLQLQRRYGNHYVQRVLALARQGEDEAGVTPDVESAIDRARGSGQGLDHGVRRQMESAFGTDFGGVRVHTGSESHELNRAVSAVAFTTGQDIFFRDGAYNPASGEGKELLAHELTHVVQQGGADPISEQAQRFQIQRMCTECEEEKKKSIQGKLTVGAPDDRYEREADSVAQQVTRDSSHEQQAKGSRAELIPDRPFSESPTSSEYSTRADAGFDVVKINEAVMTRNGVPRRVSLHNHPDAWIARRMNWKDTACKAACWAVGGAIAVLITAACAAGEVFTLGGATIPCAVALGAIGAAVGGAGASICSDLCDNALGQGASASNAQSDNAAAPDAAVADASGNPVEVPQGAPAPEESAV